MEVPPGFEARQLPVKILYTISRERDQKFVAKPPNFLTVHTENAAAQIGLINLSQCLDVILKVCPELSEFSEFSDFSLHSVDYSEEDQPLLAHGLLSLYLAHGPNQQCITGRIGSSNLYSQVLEVKLSFTPLLKRKAVCLSDACDAYEPLVPLPHSEELPVAQAMKSMPVSFESTRKYAPPRDQFSGLPSYRSTDLSSSSARVGSDMAAPPSSDALHSGIKRISPSKRFAPSLFIPPSSPPRGLQSLHGTPQPLLINGTSAAPRHQRRGDKIDKQLTQALVLGQEPDFCRNCGDVRTSTWRKTEIDGKEVNLCNACGLYYRAKKVMRPKELFNRRARKNGDLKSRREPTLPVNREPSRAVSIPLPSVSSVTPQPCDDEKTPIDPSTPSDSSSERENPADDSSDGPRSPPGLVKPSSSSDPPAPSTPDLANKENVPPDARVALLATPNKRPDQFTGGSGSARRWLRTHIFSRSEDDVFEAFMQSPSKRPGNQQTAEFDIRVQKLYVSNGPSISSSPPPFYQLDSDVNGWFEE